MNLPGGTNGVLVEQVVTGSPADQAGLLGSSTSFDDNGTQIMIGGDVITALDNQPIDSFNTLLQIVGQYNPGDQVTLSIIRAGATMQIPLTLGTNPAG